ncbi:MAG: ABC transporter permease [Bacteroidetes bacterium]|jgi:ABC-2 type transport system permease protein|nr:ABC transporter permease [Bacteroidota bacterium]
MQHSFKGFVIKEFRHILRDTRTLLILFGLPIALILIFGYAVRNEVNNAEVAILDQSRDEVTRELIQKLEASDELTITAYLNNQDEIDPVFQKGNIKQVIVFEHNFIRNMQRNGRADVQIITDASEPNIAGLLQNYTRAIFQSWNPEDSVVSQGAALGAQPTVRMLFNPQLKSVYYFVPGLIAVILMLVSALMTSISIAREKETGTMEVLLVSPLKSYEIIIGKVIPYLVLSVVNVITVVVLAVLVFEVPFRGSLLFFLFVSLLLIFSSLALGVLISTKAEDQRTAMMASLMGTMLPTFLLSGFIFPVNSMPVVLQWISHIVPAKWYLITARGAMLMGTGFTYLWFPIIILTIMTVMLMMAGVKNFNDRLE